VVLDAVGIERRLPGAALVVTGEGSLDQQSLQGKAPLGVARRAQRHGVPVIAVGGRLGLSRARTTAVGFHAAYALSALEPDLERSVAAAAPLPRALGRRIARDHLPRLPHPRNAPA
jgi:glycerate 2-kinase